MLLFVAAGLAGVLGRGLFSHRTSTIAGASLSVDCEPVTRVQTDTQITLHIGNETASPTVRVFVSTQLVEPMGLQRILPQPVAEQAAGGSMNLTFAVPPGTQDGHVRLIVQPAGIGPVPETAQLAGHPAVHWTQLALP